MCAKAKGGTAAGTKKKGRTALRWTKMITRAQETPMTKESDERERQRCKVERQLDAALADSFPASDPVAIVTSQMEEDWEEDRPQGPPQEPPREERSKER